MANGITVDISARIVGYEASIKLLQAALAKVDPGSDIGKKISQALSLVEKLSHDLGKNMFPKASSEGLIDAIVEKVNRLGAAIQDVAGMFSSLNIGDLNLKALGPEINDAISLMNKLLATVNSTLTGGIQEAVANSELLSSVFKELGINVKDLTVNGGKMALAEGMAQAAEAAAETSSALENAKTKVTDLLNAMASMKNKSPFLADDFNITTIIDLFNAIKDPSKVIDMSLLEKLKSDMLNNLSNTNLLDKGLALQFIEGMFGQIDTSTTLENFKLKLNELRQLLTSDAVGLSKNAANGVIGTTGDGTLVFNRLLGIDLDSLEASKIALRNLIATFNELISSKDMGTIIKLIDNNKLERAADIARKAISDSFDKVIKEYRQKEEELGLATLNLVALDKANEAATTQVEKYTLASNTYNGLITALELQVTQLRTEITNLQSRVEELTRHALGNILNSTSGAGANAGKNSFPLNEAKKYKDELGLIHSAELFVGKLLGVVQRWFSVYAAVRMVSNAIKKIIANTKELDATITEIAIVTNMDQDQLWGQMPKYIEMAKLYGASISGAYKVSQLYYQLGLGLSDVMALSELTLKMARISGLDYALATDYMTNAVRSFKLEMTDAASVVDTYSAVAAASATSVTELATAMSKTASSAQSVGSSLLNTTAMMAVMIEATRESPENIGSAMKSIISRYGELKENKTGIDEEGEEYSLNKVDTALLSVGISIHNAKGEFRDFDEVIFELADHWNEIDKNTQRYIATVMAGNRQQSRFLALVSSGERLKELSETAADSEDASQMQYLKTLDSIEYKSQLMLTSLLSLYANEGVLNLIKDTLDSITNIIDSFNNMSNAFDTPIAAIAKFGVQFANIARIVTTTFGLIKTGVAALIDAIRSNGIAKALQAANEEVAILELADLEKMISIARAAEFKKLMAMPNADQAAILAGLDKTMPFSSGDAAKGGFLGKLKSFKSTKGTAIAGLGLSVLGSTLSMSAMGMNEDTQDERDKKAWMTAGGSILTGAGMGAMFGLPGMIIGGLGGLIAGVVEAGLIAYEDAEERAARLKKELETVTNESIAKKNEFKTLKSTIDEYEKLKETHLDSTEAAEKYKEICNKIAEELPNLVSSYDAEGNAVVNLVEAYKQLLKAKEESRESDEKAADKAIEKAKNDVENARSIKDQGELLRVENKLLEKGKPGATIQEWINSYTLGFSILGVRDNLAQLISNSEDKETFYLFANAMMMSNKDSLPDIMSNINKYQDILTQYRPILETDDFQNMKEIYRLLDIMNESGYITGQVNAAESKLNNEIAILSYNEAKSNIDELLLKDLYLGLLLYAYLSEFKNSAVLASRYINELYKVAENQDNFFDQEGQNVFNQFNKALSTFWLTLSLQAKDILTNITTNLGNYTLLELTTILTGTNGLFAGDESNPIVLSIMAYYTDTLTSTADILDLTFSAAGKRDKTGKIGEIILDGARSIEEWEQYLTNVWEQLSADISEETQKEIIEKHVAHDAELNFISKLGENEKLAVSKFYNGILDAINADIISESTGENITLAYVDTWKYLTNSENFEGQEELLLKAQALLKDSDFTKAEGILNFVDGLKDLGITISSINYDAIKFPPNFGAAVQTFGNEMSTKLENFEKDMSSATKGMEFKKASEMASKLGININKFRLEGTKFYLDDYNLLELYYFEDRVLAITDLEKEQKRELKSVSGLDLGRGAEGLNYTLGDLLSSKEYTETWQEQLTQLFKADDFTEYLTSNQVNLNPAVLQKEIEAFMKDETKEEDQQFLSWLENHNKELYESYIEASGDVLNATLALSALSRGDIEGFISYAGVKKKTAIDFYSRGGYTFAEALEKADSYNARLIERIATGDITNLEPELEQYGELIYNTFKDSKSSLINALLDSLEGGSTLILVTLKNKTLIEGLSERGFVTGDIKENSLVDIATEALMKDEAGFKAYLDSSDMTRKLRAEALKRWHDIHYPDPAAIAQKMMTSSDRLDFDTTTDLIDSLRLGQETDEAVAKRIGLRKTEWGSIIEDRNTYIDELQKKIDDDSIDESTKRKLKAELASTERTRDTLTKIDTLKAISDLLKDTDTISEEARTALESAIDVDAAKKYFVDNGDGTHKLNVAQLRSDIENKVIDVGEAGQEQIFESFAQLGDNAIAAVTNATLLITSGTNKQEDMQKMVNMFDGLYTLGQLFTYDELLDTYTLKPEFLQAILNKLAIEYSKSMGVTYSQALNEVSKLTLKTLASLIDIDAFLKAENRNTGSKAREKLKKSLKDLYITLMPDSYNGPGAEQAKQSYLDAADETAEAGIKILEAGGANAVEKAQELADLAEEELSSEQIESYYYSEINRLQGFSDKIEELTEGSYVADEEFKDILTSVGMIDSLGLVTNLTNAVQAYKAIYEQMGKTGEQTATSLNKVYAQYLTESERSDIDAISAMGDAMGMTYETLGEILGREGKNLQEWLLKSENQGMFERIGAGKIRITDFTSFAKLRGWEPGSEEYTSAFKAYNDSLIEANQHIKLNILNEVKSIEDVHGGEQLNLTLLYTELDKKAIAWTTETVGVTEKGYERLTKTTSRVTETLLSKLQKRLAKRGATFINGVLTLEDNANLLGIILDVSNAADALGMNLGIELLDMVHSILQSYTEAIIKGIEGGMTNIEAADLLVKAKNLGLDEDLSFTETAEGLKLSQESAIQLYYALLATDVLQGQLTFDKLRENLEANNLNYKNANTVLAHIRNLNKKIANELGKYNDEQLKSYKQELMLAEQIASVHSGDKDSSWNFMNNEEAIPGTFDNAFTYIDDVASAVNFLTDASSNGIVELKGFLPILKHISELAKEAGGSIDFMGASVNENTYDEFLKQAWSMAEWDLKTGKVTIPTKTLLNSVFGFDFSKGGEGLPIEWMSSHLMEGLNVITELRAEFYDNLHDMGIAAEKDLSNINAIFGENLDIKKLKEYINTNTEFGNAFTGLAKNIKIGEKSLIDFITAGENLDSSSPAYKAIKGIMELTLFDDYDSSRGYADIIEHMALAGVEGEYTLDDITYSILGKKVLQKPKNDKEWTFEGSDQSYPTSEAAFAAMNNKEALEFAKALKQAGKTGKDNTITIGTEVFNLEYDEEKGTFKITNGKGKEYSNYETFILTEYENYVEKTGPKALSLEAWQIKLGLTIVPTLESLNGTLNNALLTALRLAGLNTKEKLEAAWAASPLEFEAKYGINLTPEEDKDINWDAIIHLILSDEMAISVQTGITNAFTNASVTDALSAGLASAFANTEGLNIPELKVNPLTVTTDGEITVEPISEALGTITHLIAKATTIEADGTITGVEITGELDGKPISVKIDKEGAIGDVKEIREAIEALSPLSITVTIPEPDASPITNAINELGNLTKNVTINPIISGIWASLFGSGSTEAKGRVGLANAKGTLMGELGPELVVSKGHYFVVGQSGPEMIDLADDAIVFNHLQTQSLLSKGTSSTRGKAITNERKAVAYATGSRHGGPAHDYTGIKSNESTSNSGNKIRNIDDPTNLLTTLTKKKESGKAEKDLKAFVKEFERWYNWLQKIAHLEKVISFEEEKRTRYTSDFIRSGKDYYTSQKLSLLYLERELAVQRDLLEKRREYNKTLREQLNNSPYSLLYTFDENFLPVYKEGMYEFVSQLLGQDFITNAGNYDVNAIFDQLSSMGFRHMMEYDSSGNKIDLEKDEGKATGVLTLVEMLEKRNELALKAHDEDIEDLIKEQELITSQNEILHEIEDNLIELENKVLNAVEDAALREIDEFSKLKDAVEKANQDLLDGLNAALDKERNMYLTSQDESELNKLQRQLALLLRSGGPASEIRSLQDEINAKNQDIYFEKLQQQIDAILEASDKEVEKLLALLDIMTETLEYQKLHGMLWQQVYQVMSLSPQDIANFIAQNNSEYWGKSSDALTKQMRDDLFSAEKWKAFSEDGIGNINGLLTDIADEVVEERKKEKEAQAQRAAEAINNNLGTETPQLPAESSNSNTDNPWGWKSSSWVSDGANVGHHKHIVYNNGQTADKEIEPHVWVQSGVSYKCSVCKQAASHYTPISNVSTKKEEDLQIVKSAHGGYANHGLYELGELGTETVLTAQQTQILRHNILSNRPDSLISLLKSYNEVYSNIDHTIDTIPVTNDNSTTIEHAEVNMKVERLANNYDAAEAADNVMQAMVNIARKTKAQNRVGR